MPLLYANASTAELPPSPLTPAKQEDTTVERTRTALLSLLREMCGDDAIMSDDQQALGEQPLPDEHIAFVVHNQRVVIDIERMVRNLANR